MSATPTGQDARARVGFVEWFRPGEHERVARALSDMAALGARDLRTGVSWADWCAPGGEEWYAWLLPTLAREADVLPCFHYTPPSLGLEPKTSSPPRRLEDYAEFVAVMMARFGGDWRAVELWNEPNNLNDWDWRLDPTWEMFAAMVRAASAAVRAHGAAVVLGGMCPIDPSWLERMEPLGVLDAVDVVGVHGFPGTWDFDWTTWRESLARVRRVLEAGGHPHPVWITEAAYSTWRHGEREQIEALLATIDAPADRVYWSSLHDLDASAAHRDGFHVDERHYHLGLKTFDGVPKLAFRLWEAGGTDALREAALWSRERRRTRRRKSVVVTGGGGFIGTNLVHHLMQQGERVVVFDNLSRPGVEGNLRWLRSQHGAALQVQVADVRDRYALERAVADSKQVFHFAAQVAVTTSIVRPTADFEINAMGTLNVLEAIRAQADPPSLVFTSTNKVYGHLPDVTLRLAGNRYEPEVDPLRARGIDEQRPLEFCSPYGCSKGAADQYVLDYSRIYQLPATVFRMSCIYGPHQCGTEDQGWVAFFAAQALRGEPLTIYGDGKQVRDVLHVEDLVAALCLAQEHIADIAGQAFNIGGGPSRTVSLLELIARLEELSGRAVKVEFEDWRPGDQRWYVSNTSRFARATGWRPRFDVHAGVADLVRWLSEPDRAASAQRLAS